MSGLMIVYQWDITSMAIRVTNIYALPATCPPFMERVTILKLLVKNIYLGPKGPEVIERPRRLFSRKKLKGGLGTMFR